MHTSTGYSLLFAALIFSMPCCFSQTAGLIYKTAGTGSLVLDPNADGYTSATPLGFTTNDQLQSEIPYKPIPVPSVEPTADPGPGPDCGFTDFVDSGVEDPELTYFDGTNLLYRMRIGNTAPNSKGYSILIDTDQKFGFSGPNADPNAVVGNPGFEIEISLQTNFFIGLYSVDGTSSPSLKTSFPYDNYAQKSIALTTNCGTPDYFYDFFIPFTAITTNFPSVTTTTPLRMLAITTMNPSPAVGNNAQSDVGGIDDAAYGYNYDNIFQTIINNFYPTPVTGINSGFPADRTSCPSITSSLNVNSTSIGGTSAEVNGTIIKVYKNGIVLNTTTVSSGTWTLSGVSGLVANDIITASATAPGKTESVINCTSIIVALSCSAEVSINTSNTSAKNIGGSGVVGATIKIYQNGVALTPNPVSSATVASDGTFCWKNNGNTGSCNGGTNSLSGGYRVTQTEPSKCESSGLYVCVGSSPTQTSAPVITTGSITTSTTSVTGTSVSGAVIELYAGTTAIGRTTASGTGWTITGLTFATGQAITAKAISGTNCLSNASNTVTVTSPSGGATLAPIITGSYCTASTISAVSGTSVEATGTTIQVYNGVTLLGSTTTLATGTWTVTGLTIASGATITARATAVGKTQSAPSNSVTIKGVSSNAGLTVNGPIVESQTPIAGTLSTPGTVNVYADGSFLGTATVTGSTWSYSPPSPATEIYAGASVTATITIGSNCESPASAAVVVQCTAPSTGLTISPSSLICAGTTTTVTITSPESGVTYQLFDGGSSSGSAKIGAGSSITLTSGILTASTTLSVKAVKISAVPCASTLTVTHAVTVTPVIATNTLTAPAVTSFCGNGNATEITGSAPSGGNGTYTYQWQSSTDNILFNNIDDATSQHYDPPAVLATTYFRRTVSSGGCASNSASVTITIQPTDLTNTITAPAVTSFCITGDPLTITGSLPTGGTGTYTYQWQSSTDDMVFNNINLATAQHYDPPVTAATTYIRRSVTSGPCVNFPGPSIKVSVASVSKTLITATPSSIAANGTSTSFIIVQLKDAAENDLTTSACIPVLSTTTGTLSSLTDNGDGTFSATLTSTILPATATVSGSLNGSPITDTETVTFVSSGIPSTATSTITAASALITANGVSTSLITIQLKDAGGTNLATGGAVVALSSTAGTLSSITDNGDGTYTAVLTAAATPGIATITGTIGGMAITDNAVVTFVPGPADATTSTITASPTSILANGVATSTITVQLKDATGNNLTSGGATVTIARTSGTLSPVTDNGNGTYTATLTSSTIAGNSSITGTVGGVALTDDEVVTFTPGAASIATSIITASPTSVVADGSSTSTITVQLKDANGNNLTTGGATVTLARTSGTISAVFDNGNGTYTATLTSSTTAGNSTVTGTIGGVTITDNEVVAFTPGAASAATSTITASPTSITANGISTSTITVQLKDANSNNLTTGGATVVLARTSGTLSAVTDNGNGTYTATLTSSTTAGNSTITGTIGGVAITDNEVVTFTPGAGSIATSTITASPTSITANGSSTSTITVQLKDANGNNLTTGGATVTLARTSGTLSAVFDNGNGTYTATLTSSTAAGNSTVTGTIGGVAITDNEVVTFAPGSASVATSTIVASPASITANGSSTSIITVQLKDTNGNNLTAGGATVALGTTSGSLSSITDNGNGTYTATLTSSTTAGSSTITGTLGGVAITDNEVVAFTPGAASTATSTITASPTSITANGSSTSIVTVQLKDANGNNVTTGGATVTLAATAGTLSTVTDNGNGTYTATLTSSTTAGNSTTTGTVGSVAILDNEVITFSPGTASIATSTITASPTSITANGASTSTITVQLKDIHGNNLTTGGGAAVVLATTDGTLSAVTYAGNGTYTATLTAPTISGNTTITGTIDAVPITDNAVVTFTPGASSAATSILAASPTSITANGSSTSTITIQLKDADGNNLTTGGATVALTATAGSLSSVTDNGNGTYTATLTSSTTTGNSTVTGTVGGVTITDNEIVSFISGAASVATSTITASSSSIVADGITTTTITVHLKDANGNNLTTGGADVALTATSGTLSSLTDNGDGTYTATLTAPVTTGNTTITGTIGGGDITDTEVVTFVPGAASTATSTLAASPTSITADGASTSTITIQLKDANGNNLTAGGATVVVSGTSGTISAVTDHGDGKYTATLTSSETAGNATITGSIDGAALTDDEVVAFTPGAASAATSTITSSVTSVLADGATTTTITIQLKDASGNNLTAGGDDVALSTTLGTLTGVTDHGDGTYTATFTSSLSTGMAVVTGTVNAVAITDTETIFITDRLASAVTSTITASPTSIAADGTSTSLITVQLKDAADDPLTSGGNTVALASTLGTLSAITDNGDGTYSAVLTSSLQPGQSIITGIVNNVGMTDDATVTFTMLPDETLISTITADQPTLPADGASTSIITITVKDSEGNMVSGVEIAISTTAGVVSDVTDHQDGTYTAVLSSSATPGEAILSYSLNGQPAANSLSITFTSPTAGFFIPEGFSPDGDGVNDTFIIQGVENKKVALQVYNRWGELVYQADEYKNNWDGLATRGVVLGDKLPDGTYFYAIDLNNGDKPLVRCMTIKRK